MTRLLTILLLMIVACPTPLCAADTPAQHCAELLDRADALKEQGGRLDEAVAGYRTAFDHCSGVDLPAELEARLTARRGDHLLFYGNDLDTAIGTYEKGLERVTRELGWAHPVRLELLEGLARALDKKARRADPETPGWPHHRAVQLYEEALRVRRQAYGPDDPRVASGLLKLAAVQVEAKPALAEELAREALELSRRHHGLYHQSVYEALVMLKDALQRQDETAEADATQELIDRVLDEIVG